MKKIMLILLCTVLILNLVGCSSRVLEGGSTNQIIDVKVGTWKTAQTIQPFFYEEYLDSTDKIEVMPFTNPGDMKTALLAGSLDMCGTTIVTAITAASKGEPVVVVCGLSNKCSALVVREDSEINTVEDLKVKKIAYVPGTMHHLLLLETLNKNGLDPQNDVELLRIDFFDMGQALAQKSIDAFYSGEPYPSVAVNEGYGKILEYPDDNEGFGIINSAMITTKDKIKNNPEMVQELVTAHVEVTEYLNKNRNAWIDKSAEFGTDKGVLDISVDNIELFWNIDEKYISSVKNLAHRMKELDLITEIPNIDEMFDLTFISQIERENNNEK